MNILYVFEPKINKDTVTYTWKFNQDPKIFKKNEFYIQYDGMDITKIDINCFYEIFISLMIPILKHHKQDILIVLPQEISNGTVNFWLSYNEANNVKVFPTVNSSIEKVKASSNSEKHKKMGILFGGGKDSLFAYKINKEIFGVENLLIVSFVFPINYANKRDLDKRRDKLALNNLKDDGAQIQKVYTNFRSNFLLYSYFNTTHTQLYFSMSYPLYIEYGLSFLTYSYEFTEYWNLDHQNNENYHFKKSRPEFDLFLSQYLGNRFANDLKVFNSNYYLSENLAFRILKDRYNSLKEIMMCESVTDPEQKWCMKCNKCGEYVLYSLAAKFESEEIDFSDFLINSDFIKKTITQTENKEIDINNDGNVNWFEGLISPIHYMSFCHMIHSIDMDFWRDKLNPEAINNVAKLKLWFGNKSYPILDCFIGEALNQLQLPFSEKLKAILNQCTFEDHSKVLEILYANTQVKIDYRLTYPVHLEEKNRLSNNMISKIFIDNEIPKFHKLYKNYIIAGNKDTNQEIPYVIQEDVEGVSFYIDKTSPKKGDYVEITYDLDGLVVNKSYCINLSLLSPYASKQYSQRFKYSVSFSGNQVLEEDISKWANENNINIYFNAQSQKESITFKVETLMNCEPWNWGKAARLVIKQMEITQISSIENDHIVVSSPFTILNKGVVEK